MNNGTSTVIWEGLSDQGNSTKSYAQMKGSFTIVDTPPTNGFTNSYALDIFGSSGTAAYYNTCALTAMEFQK